MYCLDLDVLKLLSKSNGFQLLESLTWFTWQRYCLWPAPSWCFASWVFFWWALYRGEMNGTIDLESDLIMVVWDLDEMVFQKKTSHGGAPAVPLFFWTCGIGWFYTVSGCHRCRCPCMFPQQVLSKKLCDALYLYGPLFRNLWWDPVPLIYFLPPVSRHRRAISSRRILTSVLAANGARICGWYLPINGASLRESRTYCHMVSWYKLP